MAQGAGEDMSRDYDGPEQKTEPNRDKDRRLEIETESQTGQSHRKVNEQNNDADADECAQRLAVTSLELEECQYRIGETEQQHQLSRQIAETEPVHSAMQSQVDQRRKHVDGQQQAGQKRRIRKALWTSATQRNLADCGR